MVDTAIIRHESTIIPACFNIISVILYQISDTFTITVPVDIRSRIEYEVLSVYINLDRS